MTITTPSLSATPTLKDVLDWLQGTRDMTDQSRRNMVASIRALCRVIGREPEHVWVAPADLRKVLGDASPGMIGLSATRWANVKSDVRRAVRLAGLVPERAAPIPLRSDWEDLVALEPHVCRRSALRRFGRFCSSRQIAPMAVDDQVLDGYFQDLDATGLCKTPERITRDLIAFWNRLVDRQGLDLPYLSRRGQKDVYSLSWDELPESLTRDATAFRAARLNPSPFDDNARAVRPATADQQDRMLRRLASAALRSGVAPEQLQSLRDLVRPDVVKAALSFLIERHGGETSAQVSDMINLILTVARRVEASESDIRQLKAWCRRLHHRPRGMRPRNRERLRGLVGPKVLPRLLTLPDDLVRQAQALPRSFRSAIMMQKAIAIGILLVAPVRLQNLVMLDRAVHFRRALTVKGDSWELVHAAADVKNDVDLHLPLPRWLMTIIDRYMKDYQPLLARSAHCSLLFPGRHGAKAGSTLRNLMQRVVARELGLEIHPHLFRHLSALLFLRAHPGQYETVRQLLGHKSLQTTYEHYACFEQDMAGRMYNQVIETHRAGADLGGNSQSRTCNKRHKRSKQRQHAAAADHMSQGLLP